MTTPEVAGQVFIDWAYTTLPHLRIIRNITQDWRRLPWCFQGLGLPNKGLKGANMIRYVIWHWGSSDGLGTCLCHSFETTQVDCGLEGNFLNWDYGLLNQLATP